MLHCFDISFLFTGFSSYLVIQLQEKYEIHKNLEQGCYKICKEEITILKRPKWQQLILIAIVCIQRLSLQVTNFIT